MSTENNTVETDTDDLDLFSDEFFGRKTSEPEQASSEKTEEVKQESDAETKTEDTHETEGEDKTPDDNEPEDEEDSEEEEVKEEPKPRKNRAQERIEELNKKFRETERKLNEALERLNNQKNEPTEPVKKAVEPSPDDKNSDGTDKYPLGEFDPNYIKDRVTHLLNEEREAFKVRDEQERAQRQADAELASIQASWGEKIGPAKERYPDFQEKGEDLIDTFSGLDPNYGEYLAATIMSMDFGPDVLYYLANNRDEAEKIVRSGATKATIALGRLEAKFADAAEEKQKARPKVSQAPVPPPTNKGAAVTKAEIPDDTDDLDLFSKKFFTKRR